MPTTATTKRSDEPLPEGVTKKNENYYWYQDYNISRTKDGSWELYDDHGSNIGFPNEKTSRAAKAGDLKLALEGMILSSAEDQVVRARVAAEDRAYVQELKREVVPLMEQLHEISNRREAAPFLSRLFGFR